MIFIFTILYDMQGVFRISSQISLSVLRHNTQAILSVLETFVYDPFVDWAFDPQSIAAQRMRSNSSSSSTKSTITEVAVLSLSVSLSLLLMLLFLLVSLLVLLLLLL